MKVYAFNTVVIGTGAAGFNAADRLYDLGVKDIAMLTDHVKAGTSRNTGSDKQTYYKLTLSGDDDDSVMKMARTFFDGECVDGDLALCEAALSAAGFLRLAELGVPFPKNRYGEYIGYKTDHDPRKRATSAGPYTSKLMTERLEEAVRKKNIPVFDGYQAVRILTDGKTLRGVICLNTLAADDEEERFAAFCCRNLILATGGPAGIYANSVYPQSQLGASGMAFEAGIRGKNLTEWQYGLASVAPRWNVSGTYMQVLPRFVSTEPDGTDEREFLFDFSDDRGWVLTNVFLKGYQWPFDVRKVKGGSSIIDILVYMEQCKGRKVYLDFRSNPLHEEPDYQLLSGEAREYLERAGACFGTPIERLEHMNAPAVSFYRDRNVDLHTEMLEIALCAQHNNGGLAVNCWWETGLPGIFAVGELAGSHGVYRPGGSALNAGQVGSARAAEFIAAGDRTVPEADPSFTAMLEKEAEELGTLARKAMEKGASNIGLLWKEATERMSIFGSAIRSEEGIVRLKEEVGKKIGGFGELAAIERPEELHKLFRLRDVLICQYVYLSAMEDYIRHDGKSRGSALYTDAKGEKADPRLDETYRFCLDNGEKKDRIQEITYRDGSCVPEWRAVRPIPEEDDFFENVWRSYRENGNVY